MDVVVDTDIFSTFAKVGKLGLLQKLFPKSKIFLCPTVVDEIGQGTKSGIIAFTEQSDFRSVILTSSERKLAEEILRRTSLSHGDAECIAVAKSRRSLLLSNDRQVMNEARSIAVDHLSLPLLLRELWKSKVLSKEDAGKLIDEIERKDRMVIRNKRLILG